MPTDRYRYKNRQEAGKILAAQLKDYTGQDGVVLAIPRGGIPVGSIIAGHLGFPLDIAFAKKISHPLHKEYAIGAVSLTDQIIVPHETVSDLYIASETIRLREQLKEMKRHLKGDKPHEHLEGRIVIITDDGIATGNTIIPVLSTVRKEAPASLIIAIPVASRDALEKLAPLADQIICPLIVDDFRAVGDYYADFSQLSIEEVQFYLNTL